MHQQGLLAAGIISDGKRREAAFGGGFEQEGNVLAQQAFWLAMVVSVMTGALIRVMVWAVGLLVLAAVKPEEIKVPNCSADGGAATRRRCWSPGPPA